MKRWSVLLVAALGAASGCIEREMHITSEPAGALVIVSGEEVGRTPLVRPFTWYGDYDIIVRMDGYETLKTHREINPPIYEYPPLDLLSEIAPWTYHDRRYLHFKLEPFVPADPAELLKRAVEMQKATLEEIR